MSDDEPHSATPAERRSGPEPPWAVGVWIAWVLGPGALFGLLLFIWVTTGGDPMPAEGFAVIGLAPLEVASLLLTFGMMISPGRFRRVPEFWPLVVFWISAITLFLPLLNLRSDRPGPSDDFIGACRIAMLSSGIA